MLENFGKGAVEKTFKGSYVSGPHILMVQFLPAQDCVELELGFTFSLVTLSLSCLVFNSNALMVRGNPWSVVLYYERHVSF